MYFDKYKLSNTTLADFIKCLQEALNKKSRDDINLENWSSSWLTKSGVNELYPIIEEIPQGKWKI